MLKTSLIRMGLRAINHSGLANLMKPIWGGAGVIFCLHHVTPDVSPHQAFSPNSQLEVTPAFLNELLMWLAGQNYEFVSMGNVAARLANKHTRRFAAFTLDDGYKDNFIHAMPLFQKHKCPFTVYVAPRIAEGTCELWWRGLEAIIAKSPRLKLEIAGQHFEKLCQTPQAKWAAWHSLAPTLQPMPEFEQRAWINQNAAAHGVDLNAICRQAAMTWDEIRAMAREPLATIGAHTLNHYNLRKLTETDARHEIVQSRKIIEQELQKPILHFAYPYGNKDAAGPREFELARKAGFETAVVTRLGTVEAAHANHMHSLPRIMLSGRYQQMALVNALVSGVPGRLANVGGALNVG